MKHNKKRNTAFIYEALVKELIKSVVEKDIQRKHTIVKIIKEHFVADSCLGKELDLYNVLIETRGVKKELAERLLHETKVAHARLHEKKIFDAQSRVIAAINKSLGSEVWSNFVPNFKTLASIKSIFNSKASVKQKVLFEQALIDGMVQKVKGNAQDLKSLDNLTYNSFIKKFNNKYSGLLEEQKDFLNKYITSFADEGFELRVYLNEEITRLKSLISEMVDTDTSDTLIRQKSEEVIKYLDSFRKREFENGDLTKVLKTQELVRELQAHD